MAIFSRRTVQRLINENASFLTGKQLRTHIDKLNQGDLGTEWEVVLLNVFSKLGKVEHERNFNGKKPDIYFTSIDNKLDFLADIKTVSDEGIELKNPQKQLHERLYNEIAERDIKGAWRCEIGGNHEEARKTGSMIQLKLPALARFDKEIFNESWEAFTYAIKKEPEKKREYVIKTEKIDLFISYCPSERWTSMGGYPSYKSMTAREHLIQNSVWNGLVTKSDQLKNSGYKGVLGIILCDGGSEYLGSRKVIQEFLYHHPHISFVLSFEAVQGFSSGPNQIVFSFEKGKELGAELENFLSNLHTHLDKIFPSPVKSAVNAINSLKLTKKYLGDSFFGGATMSSHEIKLSSRTVLDLLAGKITYDEFPDVYKDYFIQRLAEGRLFDEVDIEKSPNEKDDDWLNFKFGERDPAISSYVKPNTKKY